MTLVPGLLLFLTGAGQKGFDHCPVWTQVHFELPLWFSSKIEEKIAAIGSSMSSQQALYCEDILENREVRNYKYL
jgi:hypothetical protein